MTFRNAYLLGFFICAGLLAYAYYLEHVQYLDPCPLCMVQRLAFYLVGAFFLLGGLHDPGRTGRRIYAVLIIGTGMLGAATAGRHLWLQNLPPDQVPDCGPGLEYMIQHLPLRETLQGLLHGSGECARIDWSFLGLSMPAWTLVWYLSLMAWAVLAALRHSRGERRIFR
ncbi:MAG: disulfide bond formation protein B [Xanthomonadales bacterium]|nr:disulfide bond formation protein B [Xanthomonadales bacterium]